MNIPDALLPKTEDERDFTLGAAYKVPKLSEIPDEFRHDVVFIADQKQSFFCTGFATCGCSSLQEGVPLAPEFSYAVNGEMAGRISLQGYELRPAMKGHVNVGALKESDRPVDFKLGIKDEAFLADIKNWPIELKEKALESSKGSYLSVEGPYDTFDNIRAAIWMFRKEKRGVVFGVKWSWPMNEPHINFPSDNGSGHALYTCGFKGDYLFVPNSYGQGVGDNGVFYIHRNVINKFVPIYGAFMFVDLTKEEYLEKAEARKNGIIFQILKKITSIIPALSILITRAYQEKPKEVAPIKPIEPDIRPEPTRKPLVTALAKQIERYENVNKSLNNPGGLRYSPFQAGQIIQKLTGKPLAYFKTHEEGFRALVHQITIVCNGTSPAYTSAAKSLGLPTCGDLTLEQFMHIYAPRHDFNDTDKYLSFIERELETKRTTKMKDFSY